MQTEPIIIGLDPGCSGGISWRCPGNPKPFIQAIPMPDTEGQILHELRSIMRSGVEQNRDVHCYMERLRPFIGLGGRNVAGPAQIGRMMENYGFLRGVIQTLGMKLVMVEPKKWQNYFSLGTKKKAGSPDNWKRKCKAEAERRFPALSVTLKNADALLILDFALAQMPKPAVPTQHTCWLLTERCPRCGVVMATNGKDKWCSRRCESPPAPDAGRVNAE